MCTVAEASPASIWLAMESASLIGIAKASVAVVCAVSFGELDEDAAVSMPITCPAVLTSGPPESPGWIGALSLMSPLSCSEVPDPSSEAVIEELRPVTLPVATDGVPPLPSALPSATTFWPTATVEESPRFTVCSPEAPWSCRTATSLVVS